MPNYPPFVFLFCIFLNLMFEVHFKRTLISSALHLCFQAENKSDELNNNIVVSKWKDKIQYALGSTVI